MVDTAPVYGFGRSEEIVGEALRQRGRRESIILATKVGLDWTNGKIERNSTRQRILQELEDSLRRLQTDYVDIYQVHWPDPLVPVEETAIKSRPGPRFDYFHINSIDIAPDGELIVSARNTWAAYKVSRMTGRVLWRHVAEAPLGPLAAGRTGVAVLIGR